MLTVACKDRALSAHRIAMEKTATLGSRIDLVFTVIRLGMFFSDADLIARNVDKAQWYYPIYSSTKLIVTG